MNQPSPLSLKPGVPSKQLRNSALAAAGLTLCFVVPLAKLVWFAAESKLYSYILMIPFISVYLGWLKRRELPPDSRPARKTGGFFLMAGALTLAVGCWGWHSGIRPLEENYLTVTTGAFLLFLVGLVCLFLGGRTVRALAFPLAILVFMVPIPDFFVVKIDSFLQYGSAAVAAGLFQATGMAFFRTGLAFQLPDITLQIAPECSGIHSSLVLFITSLLAAYLLLQSTWKRALLVLVVIPLGLLRNGFRVFVLGELCVHMGPQMIDSPIHHQGGPIFFILSLIPLFLLLIALQRSERAARKDERVETEHE